MADPASAMAGAGMAMKVAQGAVGAYGALEKGQSTAAMYRYQAGMAQVNHDLASQNADWARKSGEVAATESGMKTRANVAAIMAGQSGSGFDVNRGSASTVRTSATGVGQMDEGIIRTNYARKAYSYDVDAAKETAQGGMYMAAASDSIKASKIEAIGSVLGGISSVATKWSEASSAGVGSSKPDYSGLSNMPDDV